MQNINKLYSNADSFAMAFDEAWHSKVVKQKEILNNEEKLKAVLALIKDHPFFVKSPSEAKQVAQFRMRLLDLK